MDRGWGSAWSGMRDPGWTLEQCLIEFRAILTSVTGESVLWFWTTNGFHIADSLQEDLILAKVLKALLPPYTGAGLTLHRGEARDRYERRALGISWTTDIEVAQMFARRWEPRGALLKIEASPEMIICGPNEDSVRLREQEYLVDTALIRYVDELR